MAFYVAPISNGLGDLFVSLPAIQALIRTGVATYLVMRSPMQEGLCKRIDGLAGSIREDQFDARKLKEGDKYFNLRDHRLQSDYIWGSKEFEAKFPGFKIDDVVKGICRDFNISLDLDILKPLPFKPVPDVTGKILFLAGSTGVVKCWPLGHWLELASMLKDKGHEVVVVGEPERSKEVAELIKSGVSHVETPRLTDAVDVISSAGCSVGVDTGLMHASVQQLTPTVSLFRNNAMFLRTFDHVRSLIAPPCLAECIEKEFASVPNRRLNFDIWNLEDAYMYWKTWSCQAESDEERCMAAISPSGVYEAVIELIYSRE